MSLSESETTHTNLNNESIDITNSKQISYILSIDIGLRNLALCIMSAENPTDFTTYKIHLWNLYDTLNTDDYHCESIQKNGNICGKKCSLKHKNALHTPETPAEFIYSCKTHFPKNIKIEKNNSFKKKNINEYLLQTIAQVFIQKIQDIYDKEIDIFSKLTSIIIELQPKINPKMKFVSHILYGKLVELYKNTEIPIRFVRASKKLLAYNGPEIICNLKGEYAKRKKLSEEYTKYFLENKFNEEQKNIWFNILNSDTKKSDRCDTFLMAINAIHGMPKKQKTDKKGKCIK
jgi:hypothetical protein